MKMLPPGGVRGAKRP